MRFLSAFFLFAWIGLSTASHAGATAPEGSPPAAADPNPPGMVDVTPAPNPDPNDFNLDVFNALPTLQDKLAFINAMRAELNRQLGLLSSLNLDTFSRLMSEVQRDRKIAKNLNAIWLVGNIAITVLLVTTPTLGLLGVTTANPLFLQLILAWVNLANALVHKAADYYKGKETAAATQVLDLVRRIANDVQQAELLYHANAALKAINDEFMQRVRALLSQRPLPPHPETTEPILVPIEEDPLLDFLLPPMGNVEAPNPNLIDQIGIDVFFSTLSLQDQAAYIASLTQMLNVFIKGISTLNSQDYDTLIGEVKTNRNWYTVFNWGWMIANGAQIVLLQVLPMLTIYNLIPNQQWSGLLTGGLGALGTFLGTRAGQFAQAAVTALTTATKSTQAFANSLQHILVAYQKQYGREHHDTEVSNRVRSVTDRPAPLPIPPAPLPLVPPPRQPNLVALAVLHDTEPDDPTRKEKGEDVPMVEVAHADDQPLGIAPMPNIALYTTISSVAK